VASREARTAIKLKTIKRNPAEETPSFSWIREDGTLVGRREVKPFLQVRQKIKESEMRVRELFRWGSSPKDRYRIPKGGEA